MFAIKGEHFIATLLFGEMTESNRHRKVNLASKIEFGNANAD